MGSVSSLINGNSLNSKHCKASEHRLKEGARHRRKSGGCSLDGLLKCGFAQGSSSSTHHSKGLSHSRSGRSEDFFYIKVSNKPKSGCHRERSVEETVTRDGKSDSRQQPKPKLLIMPGKMPERGSLTSAEKSMVHSTAFNSANPSRPSYAEIGHNSLDNILCPLRKAKSPNFGQKQDTLGFWTLSDSGRNSMSSLPTHSTSGSLRGSSGPVCQIDGSSALANSLGRGRQPNFPPWVNGNNASPDCNYGACWNSSVLASKANENSGSPLSADEPRTVSETTGGIRTPITTDESLIEHLEQRLLERETELQELQVSLEEKEADTCQLFEERQRYCAEEMEGLKQHCSTKLQQVSQMAAKSHQALQLQVSQLQAQNDKLQGDVSKLTREKNLVELRLRSSEKESTQLAPTLEETQWEICQKTGEISLLKQQLRECQADVSHKLNEIVCLKTSLKENMTKVEVLERQKKDYEDKLQACARETEVCQNELHCKKNEADFLREKVVKLEKDIQEKNQGFPAAKDKTLQQSMELETYSQTRTLESPIQESDSSENEVDMKRHISTESLQRQVERLRQQLREEKSAQERLLSSFEQERQTWNKEKDRVIKYQKQLQINYLQMHKKNRDLERVLKEQTAELESRTELGKNVRYASGLQTYDDVIATEI